MITVIVPVLVLIVLIMVKKIPFVGGKVTYALIIAGLLALLMGGVFNPLQWVLAWIDGIDKLAWIMALNIFGSIYAASQTEMKTLDLVLNVARVSLGRSPKGLIVAIILVLGLAGSLLGDSVASATVVGILVISLPTFPGRFIRTLHPLHLVGVVRLPVPVAVPEHIPCGLYKVRFIGPYLLQVLNRPGRYGASAAARSL